MSTIEQRREIQELLAGNVTSARAARTPRVSVIIPTYNRARFIGHALESVLRQVQRGDEIIVVDDGSTDDTPRILAHFGDRVVVIRSDQGGAGRARNLGLERAGNELVAFLDSDDEWLPHKLALQRSFMANRPDILYCFTNFQVADTRGRILHHYLDCWPREHHTWEEALGPARRFSALAPLPAGVDDFSVFAGDLYRWQLTGFYVLTDTLVARRAQAGEALRFAEDVPTFEDLECFCRLAQRGKAAYLDIETACQRDHDTGRLSQAHALVKLDARIRLVDRIWGKDTVFLDQHDDLYRRTLQQLEEQRIKILLVCGKNRQARAALARLSHQPWQLELLARLPVSLSLLALQIRRAARPGCKPADQPIETIVQQDTQPQPTQ
jgi:glycosyltransferase involved in cell wall biosynthesis